MILGGIPVCFLSLNFLAPWDGGGFFDSLPFVVCHSLVADHFFAHGDLGLDLIRILSFHQLYLLSLGSLGTDSLSLYSIGVS